MKLILDTHALLWWSNGDARLSPNARNAIESPKSTVFVSAVSPWELAIETKLGRVKLPSARVATFMKRLTQESDFEPLPISWEHACAVQSLPDHHKDPFDRMLIAQARIEGAALVTMDTQLHDYRVALVW